MDGVKHSLRLSPSVRVAAAVLITGLSLVLTVVRHELMHVAGVAVTGGVVTRVEWLPTPWTFGTVEMAPPSAPGPAVYYIPLCLPYVADFLLIAVAVWACRVWRFSPSARWVIVQHGVYFAALDVFVNAAAALFWPNNDWSLILNGWGLWRIPALLAVIGLSLTGVGLGRRRARPVSVSDEGSPFALATGTTGRVSA